MSPRVITLGACLVLLACQADREQSSAQSDDVLRVSTHFGLVPMTPFVRASMTSNVLELVYRTPLSEQVDQVTRNGKQVRLRLRDRSPASAETLAHGLAGSPHWTARAEGAFVVLVVADEELAEQIDESAHLVEDGVFRVSESNNERLVLVRRDGNAQLASSIEIVAMESEDTEWRRLMAGEVDLMPGAMATALPSLAEVPELRVVPMAQPAVVGLSFRVDGGPTADKEVRVAIATALRRGPLASVVDGDPLTDPMVEEDTARAREYFRSRPQTAAMRLLVFAGSTDMQRAALVVEQQLAGVGVNVDIEALAGPELIARLASREFEMLVFLGNRESRYLHFFVGAPPGNFTGYQSEEFGRLMNAGQTEQAIRVIDSDLPVTPLFRVREAVVVNRRFCNVKPVITSDFRWLADVRPCAPGEVE